MFPQARLPHSYRVCSASLRQWKAHAPTKDNSAGAGWSCAVNSVGYHVIVHSQRKTSWRTKPHVTSLSTVLTIGGSAIPSIKVSTKMKNSPRKRGKPTCNNDTQDPPDQRSASVSFLTSPPKPAAASFERQSTPGGQSGPGSPPNWSSPEPSGKVVRPTAASSPSIPYTAQRPTTGPIVSPRTVARVFDFDMYQSLLDASPMAATRTTQPHSRLPPGTDARKTPRKATPPTPATPRAGKVKKSKPQPRDTGKLRRTKTLKPSTPASKILKSAKETMEAAPQLEPRNPAAETATLPDPAQQPQRPQRPQPRFKYSLSPQLENIKKAMGEDNWSEYVIQIEKLECGEIDDVEFKKRERRIFQTPSIPGLPGVIRTMVGEQIGALEAVE